MYICIYSWRGGWMRSPLPFFENREKLPRFCGGYALIVFINGLNFLFKMHGFKSIRETKFPSFSLRDFSIVWCKYNFFEYVLILRNLLCPENVLIVLLYS